MSEKNDLSLAAPPSGESAPRVAVREPSEDRFLKDVAGHQMTIAHEDGFYRHVRFRAPQNGWNQWFDLVTWPGFLTICGDMGTWTFARVPDMFAFFRSSRPGLNINASYWSEKLQHGTHGGRTGAKEYDFDIFAARLLAQLDSYYGFEGDDLATLQRRVKDEVLSSEDRYEAGIAARDFTHTFEDGRKFRFDSCELPDGMDYSFPFIWCLWAIAWGIQQYDAAKANTSAHSPDGEGASKSGDLA